MPATKITPRKAALELCSCCNETVSGDITEHMKTCPKRLPCNLCKKTFLKSAYLKKHMNDTHRNVTESNTPKPPEVITVGEEDWDKDPDVQLDDDEDDPMDDDDDNKSESEGVSSPEPEDMLEGRVFRKPTTPMLPAQKRPAAPDVRPAENPDTPGRPVQKKPAMAAAVSITEKAGTSGLHLLKKRANPFLSQTEKPGASVKSVQEKEKQKAEAQRKISVTCEGEIKLNLGALVGEGRMLNAKDVDVELEEGKLRVDIKF